MGIVSNLCLTDCLVCVSTFQICLHFCVEEIQKSTMKNELIIVMEIGSLQTNYEYIERVSINYRNVQLAWHKCLLEGS